VLVPGLGIAADHLLPTIVETVDRQIIRTISLLCPLPGSNPGQNRHGVPTRCRRIEEEVAAVRSRRSRRSLLNGCSVVP